MHTHSLAGGSIHLAFLSQGEQPAAEVANRIAAFIGAAERTLDVAIYDFDVREGATSAIADALQAAHGRGVKVRVVFDTERCEHPADSRPPQCEHEAIDGLEVPTRGVFDQGNLMHHKYIVRDSASVLSGSTNWTPDSFTLEENVLVEVDSPGLTEPYTANFEEIWRREKVEGTGAVGEPVTVGRTTIVRPHFSPSPPYLGHLAAGAIVEANRRIWVVSPVVTAGAVLGTLCEHIHRSKLVVGGAYDRTQMEEVKRAWAGVPHNRWKIEAWKVIEPYLSGKVSTPYRPGSVHDYMHAKFVVIDDEVLTGSFNLSKHGEINAENVLHIKDNEVADPFAAFAEQVAARYSDAGGSGAVGDDHLLGRPDEPGRDLGVVPDQPPERV